MQLSHLETDTQLFIKISQFKFDDYFKNSLSTNI